MKSIGQEIATARKKQGLSIKDVEESLKIRLRFLEAIENDEFDVLPGKAYVKGFIRSYANYLKIDPAPLIEEYKEIEPKESKPFYDSAMAKLGTGPTPKPRLRAFTASAAILVIIFAMTSFLAYLGYKDSLQSQRLNDKKFVDKELKKLEEPGEKKKKKDKAKKDEKEKKAAVDKNTDLFKIKIVVTEGSWVRIKAEKKTFFSKYVKDGESQTFISRKPVEVTASKGSNVSIVVDGNEKGRLSTDPTYSTQSFDKEGKAADENDKNTTEGEGSQERPGSEN